METLLFSRELRGKTLHTFSSLAEIFISSFEGTQLSPPPSPLVCPLFEAHYSHVKEVIRALVVVCFQWLSWLEHDTVDFDSPHTVTWATYRIDRICVNYSASRVNYSSVSHFFPPTSDLSPLGSHRRAVGAGLSPLQGPVPHLCPGQAGVPVELCGPLLGMDQAAGCKN